MKDRHILVTGSSSGIGRATAEALLAEGATVTGLARNHDKFQSKSKRYNPNTLDVMNLDTLPGYLLDLLTSHPNIDGLVSNAGYGTFHGLENYSPKQISSYISDNLTSHMVITRILLPHFKTQNKGDIIFIGSEAALVGGKKGSLYCTSKFGLRGFSQAIREESADKNIRITLINPGMVRTPFFEDLDFSPGDRAENAIEPQDLAHTICSVLSMRSGTVVDEINLTPLKKVVSFD